jgi:DNA-directed RNA polymerase specialized sigma24 family protein
MAKISTPDGPGDPGEPPPPERPAADPTAAKAPAPNPAHDEELDAFIKDPSLREAMKKVVQGRVRDADVDDVVQEALLATRYAKNLPTEPTARRQYALGIARNTAITWYTDKEKDRPDSRSLDSVRREAADDGGIQRAIHAQHLEKIAATVTVKERSTLLCLYRQLVMGDSLADMAREMNVEYSTLHKRVRTLHGRVRATGIAIAALVLLLVVNRWRARDEGRVAHGVPTPPPSMVPQPPEPARGTPEAKARAAQLREDARAQCAANEWKKCLMSYDVAAHLDPEGETADVKAAHDKALDEVRRHER